jgi:hypothetical protein
MDRGRHQCAFQLVCSLVARRDRDIVALVREAARKLATSNLVRSLARERSFTTDASEAAPRLGCHSVEIVDVDFDDVTPRSRCGRAWARMRCPAVRCRHRVDVGPVPMANRLCSAAGHPQNE